jgi:hypothetical protein
MDILTKKIISVGFVVLLIIICLAISYFYSGSMPSVFSEGFEIMTDTYDRPKNKLADGITEVDDMSTYPHGMYKISNNPEKFSRLPTGSLVGDPPYGTEIIPPYHNIPYGYYIVKVYDNEKKTTNNKMAKVPSGYIATLDNADITPIKHSSQYTQLQTNGNTNSGNATVAGSTSKTTNLLNNKEYNAMDPDATYHLDSKFTDAPPENCTYMKDATGAIVCVPVKGNGTLPTTGNGTLPTYYQPGSFQFSSSNFVPNYEDSVYLSMSTGLYTVANVLPSATSSAMGGFCNAYIKSPTDLEQKCLKTDVNTCASTNCCVLLGGSKCVSGNASGPTMKANYSDRNILNRDFYFFNGKCYGNCM